MAAGALKLTFPLAWTTSLLAWSLLSNTKAYNAANETARTLTQLQWGADYLMKTIYKDAGGNTQIIYQARCLALFVNTAFNATTCLDDLMCWHTGQHAVGAS